MRPTFEHTVDILVKACLNDTLRHGDDCCCAVGNLICHGLKIKNPLSYWEPNWFNVFRLRWLDRESLVLAQGEIDATGYTVQQILAIEEAFEKAHYGNSDDQYMFNGLMAVVDVLAEIHGVNFEVKESAKLLFVKP